MCIDSTVLAEYRLHGLCTDQLDFRLDHLGRWRQIEPDLVQLRVIKGPAPLRVGVCMGVCVCVGVFGFVCTCVCV